MFGIPIGFFMKKAEITRQIILEKAFELIYTKGYQTTSIDEIIATTKVTKGAFYYHFKNKDQMGVAIINDILKPTMQNTFINPLKATQNPTVEIYNLIKSLLFDIPFLKTEFGCPFGNLAQEMTPWNTEFANALSELLIGWQQTLEQCIDKGKQNGTISENVNPQQVAFFVMSGYWGIRNFGKVYNSSNCYVSYLKELKFYLNSLT